MKKPERISQYTHFALGMCLLTIGCDQDKSVESPVTTAVPVHFRWPTATRFQVEETVRKTSSSDNSSAVILHTFDFAPTNGGYALKWVDVDHLEVNGLAVTNLESRKELAAARELYLANPPMLISSNGEFLGTINLDINRALTRMDGVLNELNPERTNQSGPRLVDVFDNPRSRELYDRVLSQYWTTWVAQWNACSLRPRQSTTNIVQLQIDDSAKVPATIILQHLGAATNQTDHVHLHYEEFVEGKRFAEAIEKQLASFAKGGGEVQRADSLNLKSAARLTVLDVATDPKTLIPSWARRWAIMVIDEAGAPRTAHKEIREYRFIWSLESTQNRPAQNKE